MKLRNKKTGEIVDMMGTYNECTGIGLAIDHHDGNPTSECYRSLAELLEEWEDYEEPKKYYYISDFGAIQRGDVGESDIDEMTRKDFGNHFETKEEVEKAVEKLKAWKRLKDKGFEFHGHNALGFGEITFSLDFEDMDDEGEIGQLRHDLDLLFGGEE